MASAAPSLLPGQHAPLAIITSTDKAGIAIIVTALGLAIALVSGMIRLYVRYVFSPNRFSWDDAIIGVAFVFSIFQSATVFVGVHNGFGKTEADLSAHNLVAIQKANFANDILYIISLWLTKISVAALFLRLSPKNSHVLVSKANIYLAIPTAVIAILIVSLRCNLSEPWININADNAQCPGLFARWQTVTAFDISTEILLLATSVFLVYSLQMSIYRKLTIIFAFAMRLPVIIPSAFQLHYLSVAFNSSDATLVGVYAVACRQSELAWAITAATIPCLRPFITATATNYGAPAEGPRTKDGVYGIYGNQRSSDKSSRNTTNPIPLASLTSKLRSMTHDKKPASSSDFNEGNMFEPQYTNNGAHASRDARSIESGESTQMIILKNVTYKIEHES